MITLITNIKELLQTEDTPKTMVCGKEMKVLPSIKNAFLLIKNNKIIDFGTLNTKCNH